MARTINEIEQQIIDNLLERRPDLSSSKVAEWRLWSYVVAVSIHAFEVILDLFRSEIDSQTAIAPGTIRWYREMCFRFQNGYKPVFDPETATLKYETEDPDARIIKVVSIVEGEKWITAKVAKTDENGKIVPLSDVERKNFSDFLETIAMGGIQVSVVSTNADTIRYDLEVYYDPSISSGIVQENIKQVLENFKTEQSFDAVFYSQRLVNAVMSAEGVVTVNTRKIEHKTSIDADFETIDVMVELEAGYFEYAQEGNTLTMTSVKTL